MGERQDRRMTLRTDWRFSVSSMWHHMKGSDIQDHLVTATRELSKLKEEISVESKKNYALEKEIRALDQKIALLVKNRISLEEAEAATGDYQSLSRTSKFEDEKCRVHYENLFYLLADEPHYMAVLAHEVKLGEIDSLLRTVMFTLFGNQYEAHDEHKLLILFENVLGMVYAEAKEKGSLMRSNTAITRMMTTYTRRGPGQDFLKGCLTGVINDLCDEDISMEMNPLKVYDAVINKYETETGEKSPLPRTVLQEAAEANEDVIKMIADAIPRLLQTGQKFLDQIISSIEDVPYGIRWICKQISVLTQNKFPDATRKERSSLIGGFFLLRFVNPSIVTPHSFMIISKKPSPTTRRNLTFVAKLMQNLSNGIRFGEKEKYMEPLNAFIDKNIDKLHDFFDALTDVEDPRDHLEVDEYIEMARTSVPMIDISLNEIYLMHSLVSSHLEKMTGGNESDTLAQIMANLTEVPKQVPRANNGTIHLHLSNFHEEEEELDADNKVLASQVYSDTKTVLFNLYRAIPELAENESPSLLDALDAIVAEHSNPKGSAKEHDQEIIDLVQLVGRNLKMLDNAGLVTKADNFQRIREQVRMEVSNIDSKLDTIKVQKEKLTGVLDNIKAHTSYLLGQHESFRAYLDNVREKAYKTEKKDGKKVKKGKVKVVKQWHNDLEKKGIITESEIPDERKQFVQFLFTNSRPGVLEILVKYKGQGRNKELSEMELFLDDLLEQQYRGEMTYELEYVTLDVNMIVHFFKKNFMNK